MTLRGLEGTDRMKVLLTGRTLGMKGSVTIFDSLAEPKNIGAMQMVLSVGVRL